MKRLFRVAVFLSGFIATINCAMMTQRASLTTQCNTFSWTCDNGQCIDSSEQCDGTVNCDDRSDETTENCIATTCPKYAFRCSYGACVAGNAECNRKVECVDRSDEMTSNCPTKKQTDLSGTCDQMSFQCDNGECIAGDTLCDGDVDCQDGSDEIVKYCAASPCPSYAFRCGYGACIAGKKKCDDRVDCVDGSDENYLLCGKNKSETTVRPQTSSVANASPSTSGSGSCRVDNIPERGDAVYQYDTTKKVVYGAFVDNFNGINYRCIQNHYLIGNDSNICIQGKWKYSTPECKPRCNASEIQGVTIIANCYSYVDNAQKSTQCNGPVEPGTIAHVNCQLGYERAGPQQVITCESDGRWTPLPAKCTQTCGEINEGTAYVVGGNTTDVAKVPWHAGIYKRLRFDGEFEQWCGGTIVNSRAIVSAMHCFWDSSENRQRDTDEYKVIVGKTYRKYDAYEDHKPQEFGIEQIFYEPGYNDYAGNYANDVVVVILDKYIDFHSYIAPICLPQNLMYDERMVPPGWIGIAAGWGLIQSNGQPSPVLKKIQLPVVSREECKEKSAIEFVNFITNDKFCAGYLTGASVCQGDSGGGLVFPRTVGQRTTYYLRGIVSTGGNRQGSCDSDKYTTFTNVAYYIDLINIHIIKYQPKL